MSTVAIVALFMRWAHILSAIIALGGSVFIRFVLMPSAQTVLDDKTHQELRSAVTRRWMKFVHTCILLFLISGFFNYIMVTSPDHKGQALYHALFGIKCLLALVVFALAVALTSLKNWSAKLRENAKVWLSLLIALAVLIVLISGYMRAMPKVTAAPVASIEIQK